MAGQRNLNDPNLERQLSQSKRNATASPLGHSSIGREGLRIYDGGILLIENGGLDVTGTASISGSLSISGILTQTGTSTFTGDTRFTGQTDIWGPLTVTGPTKLNGVTDIGGNTTVTGTLDVTGVTTLDGDTTVNGLFKVTGDSTISGKLDVTGNMASKGTLSIDGVTTLKKDMNVVTGGKINVGQLQIEPAGGGQINFTGGSISRSSSFGMLANDAIAVELAAPVVKLSGANVQLPNLPSTTSAANVYFDPASKRLYYKS